MRTNIPTVSIKDMRAIIVETVRVCLSFTLDMIAKALRKMQANINGKGT